MHKSDALSIGELAKRTGLAVSAIRFYEEKGLITARRNEGNRRYFFRSDIRRLSFVMIAQKLGFTIQEIREKLKGLPDERTPNKKDWTRISQTFRTDLDARIEALTQLRDSLNECIGCGCLSLKICALYNPEDHIRSKGTGPRYLMGDKPEGEAPD